MSLELSEDRGKSQQKYHVTIDMRNPYYNNEGGSTIDESCYINLIKYLIHEYITKANINSFNHVYI